MTNIAMGNGPFIDIEIEVYLLKIVIFHGYVSHNQMVKTLECFKRRIRWWLCIPKVQFFEV